MYSFYIDSYHFPFFSIDTILFWNESRMPHVVLSPVRSFIGSKLLRNDSLRPYQKMRIIFDIIWAEIIERMHNIRHIDEEPVSISKMNIDLVTKIRKKMALNGNGKDL